MRRGAPRHRAPRRRRAARATRCALVSPQRRRVRRRRLPSLSLHAGAVCVPLNTRRRRPPSSKRRLSEVVDAAPHARGRVVGAARHRGRPPGPPHRPRRPPPTTQRCRRPCRRRRRRPPLHLRHRGKRRPAMLTHANLGRQHRPGPGKHPGLAAAPRRHRPRGAALLPHLRAERRPRLRASPAPAQPPLPRRSLPAHRSSAPGCLPRSGVTILAGVPDDVHDELDVDPADTAARHLRVRCASPSPAPPPSPTPSPSGFGTATASSSAGLRPHRGRHPRSWPPPPSSPTPPRPGSIRPAALPGLSVRLVDEDGADALGRRPRRDLGPRPERLRRLLAQTLPPPARALADGWLHTGDLSAVLDEHDDFRLVDRRTDLILVAGAQRLPRRGRGGAPRPP